MPSPSPTAPWSSTAQRIPASTSSSAAVREMQLPANDVPAATLASIEAEVSRVPSSYCGHDVGDQALPGEPRDVGVGVAHGQKLEPSRRGRRTEPSESIDVPGRRRSAAGNGRDPGLVHELVSASSAAPLRNKHGRERERKAHAYVAKNEVRCTQRGVERAVGLGGVDHEATLGVGHRRAAHSQGDHDGYWRAPGLVDPERHLLGHRFGHVRGLDADLGAIDARFHRRFGVRSR